ncbi:MAG: toxin-antitoxin system HicB family antitoxin [Acidobacteriota bacterium]
MTTPTMEQISSAGETRASSQNSASALLAHYLRLPYRIELVEDEGAWVASNPDLPGCASFGTDPDSAVDNLAEVRRLWIEGRIASGNEIPEPSEEERFSGKFVLRIPKSLHRIAEMKARAEGVSLNALITNIVAGALGFGQEQHTSHTKAANVHKNPWRPALWNAYETGEWCTSVSEGARHETTRRGATVFLHSVANRLGTHHKSEFDPNKEFYHAEEKRLAHK